MRNALNKGELKKACQSLDCVKTAKDCMNCIVAFRALLEVQKVLFDRAEMLTALEDEVGEQLGILSEASQRVSFVRSRIRGIDQSPNLFKQPLQIVSCRLQLAIFQSCTKAFRKFSRFVLSGTRCKLSQVEERLCPVLRIESCSRLSQFFVQLFDSRCKSVLLLSGGAHGSALAVCGPLQAAAAAVPSDDK